MHKDTNQIRLCFVAHRFQRNDGQGRVNYEIVRAALNHGYHVTVLATHCAEEIANHPQARFVKAGPERLPTELLRNVVFATTTARWLRRHRQEVDLVQANGFVTWEPCDVVAAHFIHKTWGGSSHYPFKTASPYSMYQRLYTFLNSRWEKKAYLSATLVIAVSKSIGREVVSLGVPTGRVKVIPNGVDTDQFHPGAGNRTKFNLPLKVPLALFVGDIRTPRKNLDTVLKALLQVPEAFLAVAGNAEGSPFPGLARELGVEKRVIFLGKVAEIEVLMRSVDLFVFPSRYEAHPLVLLEAMASGVPMIVSASFGAADFIGTSGKVLLDAEDANTLAAEMRAILANPQKRQAMSTAGRDLALTMQWPSMASAYLKVYEELAAKA